MSEKLGLRADAESRQRIETLNEIAVVSMAASLFISIYVTAGVGVAFLLFALVSGQMRGLLSVPCSWCILSFAAIALPVSLAVGGLLKIAAVLSVIGVLIGGMLLRRMMTAKIFESAVTAACGASLYSGGITIFQSLVHQADRGYRPDSVFVNPNYLAAACVIIILFSLYKLAKNPNSKDSWLFYLALAVNIVGLILSDCRTALVVAGISVAILLFFMRRYRALTFFLYLAVSGFILIIINPELIPRSDNLDTDMSVRLSIWKSALWGITQRPLLGWGAMAYEGVAQLSGGFIATHAHNIVLELMLSYGFAGLMLLYVYFRRHVVSAAKQMRAKVGRDRLALFFACAAAFVFHGLSDAVYLWPQTALLLLLALSVTGIPANEDKPFEV